MTAHVLTVGSGLLIDEDQAGLSVVRALRGEGMAVSARQIVDDDEGALETALTGALRAGALVVVLSGRGGSDGEIVPRVLARLSDSHLALNAKFLALLEEDFGRRGQAMPTRLDRLALLPRGAALWPAPAGEPGWAVEARGAQVAVLPRESPELPALIDEQLRPLCRRQLGRTVEVLRTLLTAGLTAGDVEDRLAAWLGKAGAVTLSSAIVRGDVHVRLVAHGASRARALRDLEPLEAAVRTALGEDCYGCDDATLEGVVAELLVDRRLTVSVAESCTGGLLAHRLTSVAGASRYFERGVTAYSNRAKAELLGVPARLLETHGAVSAPVVEAMASGVCRMSGSRCGLAVTGLAGPGDGTPSKPVGTVFIAVAGPTGLEVRRCRFTGSRGAVRWRAAQAALDMLRRALLRSASSPEQPS